MPYLKESERNRWDHYTNQIQIEANYGIEAGDLNYLITKISQAFIKSNGENYSNLNAVIGALESAKLEFYRRLVSEYEDKKIQENGDVYRK